MHLRSILSGTLALLLLSGGVALSQEGRVGGADRTVPMPRTDLPGVFGAGSNEGFRVAQAGDPRVSALEEQIRQLSGTIEELNFQILQMQEQMRKMQEDNEFRFQELEKKRSDASGGSGQSVAGSTEPTTGAAQETTPKSDRPANSAAGSQPGAGAGTSPKTFGTIVFDADGNVTGGSVGDQITAQPPGTSGDQVAALPATDDPEEVYRNSYEFILSGDYKTAEAGFRDHIARFPGDPKTADAHFWLGEALLGQQKYRDAAEIFLAASKEYPSSKKAPEMLLKLGMSLAGLKQRDVACATFSEVGKRYPGASAQLKERVKQEQALAAC
ncbi:tol-pal system protein YbgF [Mesorhizobium sp. L-8-3]|uniref:tol-pal system protein YbgF n=1 Tax=Mesorhizobium sp. L-8-3 TaxID=2744522 RepID=UPI0019293A67|nr:tol-pal system protein YbgF [Mesorhizobium sp. L-8-3]BCH22431.1 tol-pal system protein YbgF [Mesorhizobium sp. L-8-3]